jgi:hypothetical protein
MEFTVNVSWLVNRLNGSGIVKVFEDECAYYCLFANERWFALDKEHPQSWYFEELAQEYLGLLYHYNKFSDSEWESKDISLMNDIITFKIDLEDNREIIIP